MSRKMDEMYPAILQTMESVGIINTTENRLRFLMRLRSGIMHDSMNVMKMLWVVALNAEIQLLREHLLEHYDMDIREEDDVYP